MIWRSKINYPTISLASAVQPLLITMSRNIRKLVSRPIFTFYLDLPDPVVIARNEHICCWKPAVRKRVYFGGHIRQSWVPREKDSGPLTPFHIPEFPLRRCWGICSGIFGMIKYRWWWNEWCVAWCVIWR